MNQLQHMHTTQQGSCGVRMQMVLYSMFLGNLFQIAQMITTVAATAFGAYPDAAESAGQASVNMHRCMLA